MTKSKAEELIREVHRRVQEEFRDHKVGDAELVERMQRRAQRIGAQLGITVLMSPQGHYTGFMAG
jgi:hypothetical protein